jgi:hypothetical protein
MTHDIEKLPFDHTLNNQSTITRIASIETIQNPLRFSPIPANRHATTSASCDVLNCVANLRASQRPNSTATHASAPLERPQVLQSTVPQMFENGFVHFAAARSMATWISSAVISGSPCFSRSRKRSMRAVISCSPAAALLHAFASRARDRRLQR